MKNVTNACGLLIGIKDESDSGAQAAGMLFSVLHHTRYRYSAPIRLGAHELRLSPRPDAGTVQARSVTVTPPPVRQTERMDVFGNRVVDLEFDGETADFAVESRFLIETGSTPPFPGAEDAGRYLARAPIAAEVQVYAAHLAAGQPLTEFLERLNRDLFERTDRRIRRDGAAQTSLETLQSRSGACRDLTVLFIEACRSRGLPARFVSGYQARAESVDGKRHLHAWPEVYLPEIGWRGYDPTHGMPVTDGHVAVCAGPEQAHTMPIVGGFWGGPVTSTLEYSIEIEVNDGASAP